MKELGNTESETTLDKTSGFKKILFISKHVNN